MAKTQYILILLCSIAFFSCRKDKQTVTAPDLGKNYYPAKIGGWVSYDVDCTVYDGLLLDTLYYSYQIKEVFESYWIDNSGDSAIRIERFHRNTDTSAWGTPRIWTGWVRNDKVERSEENVKFIKLTFPVSNGNKWNGNAYNTMGEQLYEYENVNLPENIGGFNFDSVLTVNQLDNINILERRIYNEKYAKGVGLVYKRQTDYEIKRINNTGPEYASGYDVRMIINTYGGF